MNKIDRSEMIRELASKPLALSPVAAEILEELRKEDGDLGGSAPIGEILPPDDVRQEALPVNEDEESPDSLPMSPMMRRVLGDERPADEIPDLDE